MTKTNQVRVFGKVENVVKESETHFLLENGMTVSKELAEVVAIETVTEATPVQETTITVYFEQGYKWTVNVQGEEESRVTNVNKVDAMAIARQINKAEYNNKANIIAQKLSKEERKENMQWLHENTYTFNTNKAI